MYSPDLVERTSAEVFLVDYYVLGKARHESLKCDVCEEGGQDDIAVVVQDAGEVVGLVGVFGWRSRSSRSGMLALEQLVGWT